MRCYRYAGFLFLFGILLSGEVMAQIPSFSPLGKIQQEVGNTTVEVEYERPLARGREIYGGLVPWDKVWRTGAGYCTKLRFSKAVMVGDQPVPAGRYSLLSIPGKKEWMIILNKDTSLYSGHNHDPEKDVARFRVRPTTTSRHYEALTIDLDLEGENARLYISWTDTQLSFPINTSTEAETMAFIDGLFTRPLSDTLNYTFAAEYLFFGRKDLQKALKLTELDLQAGNGGYVHRLRMELFEYLGHKDKAVEEVRRAVRFRKAHPLDAENQAWDLREWAMHEKRLLGALE
ncbi:DUF2911 domain-containing protein [Neolewinella persica]|uniref:DUF2911 domain-containing protein n=1 Tax=Neolewinella persica TaxID=70998 RepID=UPI0003A2FF18|nr:DUF2911 domain-containing protein [Neolewinella persica]